MGLRQVRIGLNGTQGGLFRTFPRARRRRFDVPVQQRVAVSKLGVCDSKFRIELDCTLESLDRLSQPFGCSARRVVTSGSVELTRFFILPRLRVRRGHQDLRRYRRDICARLLSLLLGCDHLLLYLAVKRRMSQVAKNSFKDRIATQRIKLWLDP